MQTMPAPRRKDTLLTSPQSFLFALGGAIVRDIRGVPVAMLR